MPQSAPTFRPAYLPPRHATERERGSASARGYDRAWQKVRDAVLAEEPLCRFCFDAGRVTAAEEVDHIKTVRDRPDLRLVRANLRPLCKPCHSTHTGSTSRVARPD